MSSSPVSGGSLSAPPAEEYSYKERQTSMSNRLVKAMTSITKIGRDFLKLNASYKELDGRVRNLEERNPKPNTSAESSEKVDLDAKDEIHEAQTSTREEEEDSKEMDEAQLGSAAVEEEDGAVDEPSSHRSFSSRIERGIRSHRKQVPESSDSDSEDEAEEPSSPLVERDIRILDKTSGNWVRPNVHFDDGTIFNTFNHRIFIFGVGSVVRGWNRGDSVEVVRRDTWTGIDPYLLTNQRTGSSVSGHSWN